MKNDIDIQFLCKDCDRYNLCEYYHNRKKESYICKNFHLSDVRAEGKVMRKEHLDNIRNYIVDNIIRNPDYLFSDEIRGKEDSDIDLLTVIASLYEELHHEVTGEDYNYMWHFANKYGAWVDDKLFIDLKGGDSSELL